MNEVNRSEKKAQLVSYIVPKKINQRFSKKDEIRNPR